MAMATMQVYLLTLKRGGFKFLHSVSEAEILKLLYNYQPHHLVEEFELPKDKYQVLLSLMEFNQAGHGGNYVGSLLTIWRENLYDILDQRKLRTTKLPPPI